MVLVPVEPFVDTRPHPFGLADVVVVELGRDVWIKADGRAWSVRQVGRTFIRLAPQRRYVERRPAGEINPPADTLQHLAPSQAVMVNVTAFTHEARAAGW